MRVVSLPGLVAQQNYPWGPWRRWGRRVSFTPWGLSHLSTGTGPQGRPWCRERDLKYSLTGKALPVSPKIISGELNAEINTGRQCPRPQPPGEKPAGTPSPATTAPSETSSGGDAGQHSFLQEGAMEAV